jgi:glycosyltransferase involved in cell wall biosynthesis
VRILLLSQFYPPILGGEERHVRNLALALSRRGHDVTVATQWIPGTSAIEFVENVVIHRIKGLIQRFSGVFAEHERRHAPPFPDPELVAGLRRLVVQFKPDVVHAHNWLARSFLPVKLWRDVPLVVTLHDYSLICPKKNLIHNAIHTGEICSGPQLAKCCHCASDHYGKVKGVVTTVGKFAFSRLERRTVDKFLAVSHSVVRHSRLAEMGINYEVIPNFIPDDVAVLSPDVDPCVDQLPEHFILFVGDQSPLKGVPVLLNAYAGLTDAPPLMLIGRRGAVLPKTLPPNVYQLDPWPHTAIMHAWHRCLFGVAPSTWLDACPTVVMEAMACGKPVVATDLGGTPDIINESSGILVPPGNVGALRDALQKLMTNRDMITRMGRASLERVGGFKAGSVVPQIERVYQACAA